MKSEMACSPPAGLPGAAGIAPANTARAGSPCDTLGLTVGKLQLNVPQLNIGPNPNNGNFNIHFSEQKISGVLEVYDLNGQLLHTEYVSPWSNTKQLNLQNKLSNGMYALRLSFGEQASIVKFVVTNSPLERG